MKHMNRETTTTTHATTKTVIECKMQHAVAMLMHDALSHMAMSRFQIVGDYYTLSPKDQFYHTIINIKHDHYKSLRKVDKEQKEKKREEEEKLHNPPFTQKPPSQRYLCRSFTRRIISKKRKKQGVQQQCRLSI